MVNTWSSIKAFEPFLGADDLKKAIGTTGVLEAPTIIVLNEVNKG
jgi:hypothetical protein